MLQLIVEEENMIERLQASITYFRDHLSQMEYAQFATKKLSDWLWGDRSSL